MKLTLPTKSKDIRRSWHLIDVNGKILGRISTEISSMLIGKLKPYFVNNLDCGDFVVVVNASKIKVTGKKDSQKSYSKYSGFPGGLKSKNFNQVLSENPERILKESVAGMLPKNRLRASMLKRLFIFPNAEHNYKEKISS